MLSLSYYQFEGGINDFFALVSRAAPIVNLGLTATKFRPESSANNSNIQQLLQVQPPSTKSAAVTHPVTDSAERKPFFHRFMLPSSPPEKKSKTPFFNQFKMTTDEVEENESSPIPPPSTSNASLKNEGGYLRGGMNADNSAVCDECGSRVFIHLMPEHSDFHFAKKIQLELNPEMQPQIHVPPDVRSSSSRGGKRGRKKVPAAAANSEIHRRIDGFFIKH